MNFKSCLQAWLTVVALIGISSVAAQSDGQQWYGGSEDVAFAEDLWNAMLQAKLVGGEAQPGKPYIGLHPHGAILESEIHTIAVRGVSGILAAKRSYRGVGITVEDVEVNRSEFIVDITVMFKREAGYDSAAQNWFWAKYNPDGSLDVTPNGVQLAGRIAKGKPKGCIACHLRAPGGDLLFAN